MLLVGTEIRRGGSNLGYHDDHAGSASLLLVAIAGDHQTPKTRKPNGRDDRGVEPRPNAYLRAALDIDCANIQN